MWAKNFLPGHTSLPELQRALNALSHMSEPHALMGEAQICNYFVPVERTVPPHTCSNSRLWKCWKA